MTSPLLPVIQEKVVYRRVAEGELMNFEMQEW